jgi:hypothetical protein
MTELNLAYEKVIDYLTTPRTGLEEESPADHKRTAKTQTKTRTPTRYQTLFIRCMNRVLDGVYTYYQYGLENVKLRYEGVRRFRFRDSIRDLQEGIESLEALKSYPKSEGASGRLQLFTDFSKAFLQSALIDNYIPPVGEPSERVAYRHFRNGSAHLDYAIKDALFGDQLIQVRSGSYGEKLRMSREELMLVVSRYYNSGCFSEAMIKIYLLEVFSKVVQLLQRMRY